jgi:hypothetical protein
VALIVLLALAALYTGDYLSARYRIPGNRQTLGNVQVLTQYAVRQKDGRIEYSLGDTETDTCVRSLFPQLGYPPCWYLSRHTTKLIQVGRAEPALRSNPTIPYVEPGLPVPGLQLAAGVNIAGGSGRQHPDAEGGGHRRQPQFAPIS